MGSLRSQTVEIVLSLVWNTYFHIAIRHMLKVMIRKKDENWRTKRKKRRRSQKLLKWCNIRNPISINLWMRLILAADLVMAAMDIMDWCIILEEDCIRKNTVEALEVCLGGLRHPLFFLALVSRMRTLSPILEFAGNQSRFQSAHSITHLSHLISDKQRQVCHSDTQRHANVKNVNVEICLKEKFRLATAFFRCVRVCIEYISEIGMYTETHTQILSSDNFPSSNLWLDCLKAGQINPTTLCLAHTIDRDCRVFCFFSLYFYFVSFVVVEKTNQQKSWIKCHLSFWVCSFQFLSSPLEPDIKHAEKSWAIAGKTK